MSAQGATLGGRGNVLHLPIWPVAALVAVAAAALIGLSLIDGAAPVREHGAEPSVVVGISHATPRLSAPTSVGYVGLENAGSYLPQSTYVSGLENPSAYGPAEVAPTVAGPATGIMVNGEICHQCR